MRVLVDTQALLWWLMDSDRLGRKARRIFMAETPIVSAVSLWEMAIKVGLGKLEADLGEVCAAIAEQGFERLGLSDRHVIALAGLDHHHRDPFDRMLVVQGRVEGLPILTSDGKLGLYRVEIIDSRL